MESSVLTESASAGPLSDAELQQIDAWWRAANYLSVGQIYLLDNPLLREPLAPEHIKPRLLGHWGTTPGLNFVYVHMNRAIRQRDLNAIYVTGPGHGGPGLVANAYLDGTYTEIYHHIGHDEEGLRRLFRQFSFPGGIPSHVAPETPGSINEGGELGYCLLHAYGAVFDNPDLLALCVVGDGEAETGPLAASWHSNKFLNPATDGAVLPILHLNGYKIANPTVLARIPYEELDRCSAGTGMADRWSTAPIPVLMHRAMAAALDGALDEIAAIQRRARGGGRPERPRWPMIVLRTPKGWTGPKIVDGLPTEGTFRSHQVPLAEVRTNPAHLQQLGGLDALLPTRGAVRRERCRGLRDPRAGADRAAPDERQPARQRRPPAASAGAARLPRLRGRGRAPRHRRERGDEGPRRLAARRDRAQPRQLPDHRPRRDRLEPAVGSVRGRPTGCGRPSCATTTSTWRPRAG